MPSPTSAKIVAEAYGYQIDNQGRKIALYRYTPKEKSPTREVATICVDGSIIPIAPYTREDHECAMAIRATMAVVR